MTISIQNYLFASAAAALTARLRNLSFRAILRQDIEFFDRDENSVSEFFLFLFVAFTDLASDWCFDFQSE